MADTTENSGPGPGRSSLEYAAWLVETARLELQARGLDPAKVDAAVDEAVETARYLILPLSEGIKHTAMVDFLQAQLGNIDEATLGRDRPDLQAESNGADGTEAPGAPSPGLQTGADSQRPQAGGEPSGQYE